MDLSPILVESKTGSEFLRRVEAHLKKSEQGFSYADFARRAGFSARSYVREVFQGRKSITLKALPRFASALGLRREEREIFRCLLAIENPDFDPALPLATAEASLRARVRQWRRRTERKRVSSSLSAIERAGSPDAVELWPRVYAALVGDTSAAAIARRTKVSVPSIERVLRAMLEAGVVREEEGKYFPGGRHLVLDPNLHAEMIRDHFKSVASEAIAGAEARFHDPNRAYFVSSFGVRTDRLPELKKRLIETLLRFVDEVEDGESEEIVSLAATLF